MSKIIRGETLSSNSQPSKISGIVCPEREKRWAAELAASRKNKSPLQVDCDRFHAVDKSTGELRPMSGEQADQELIKRGKINRFRYDRQEAEAYRYQATDPGVLLKRLFLADQAEKRSKDFDSLLDLKAYAKPIEGCSGFEYLDSWSDIRMVSEITVGSQDVMISSTLRGGRAQLGGGARKKITEWSKQSRGRCEKHIRNVEDGSIKAFLTLTYPNDFTNDGVRVKRDLATMLKRLKRMGVKDGIWFLEFQKRGAPHFHCFLSQWPKGGSDSVANAWHEIAGGGDKKHLDWHLGKLTGRPCLEYMRKPHAASYYACKYAVKAEQKDVPALYQSVGRFWGYWGDLKPVYQTYYARGSAACAAAVRMIASWKFEKFGGVVGDGLVLYSATLRGCSPLELDKLFQSSGWCPDA